MGDNTTFSIFVNEICVFSKNFRFSKIFPFFSKNEPKLAQKIEKIEISNPQEFSKKKFKNLKNFFFRKKFKNFRKK